MHRIRLPTPSRKMQRFGGARVGKLGERISFWRFRFGGQEDGNLIIGQLQPPSSWQGALLAVGGGSRPAPSCGGGGSRRRRGGCDLGPLRLLRSGELGYHLVYDLHKFRFKCKSCSKLSRSRISQHFIPHHYHIFLHYIPDLHNDTRT